jgi:radical SAM protein with 4Fe4S-binding SPASM domain
VSETLEKPVFTSTSTDWYDKVIKRTIMQTTFCDNQQNTEENYRRRCTNTSSSVPLPHLDIELTERCNNSCIHCYINLPITHSAQQRELSTNEWVSVLKQATDLGTQSIRFTGGEPLLRLDFVELFLNARRLGLEVQIFTNARLITPELARLFAHNPLRKRIEITVYGMTEYSYDAVTCATGAYRQFRTGLDLLLEYKVPFLVKWIDLPQNHNEWDDFERWAVKLPWTKYPPTKTMQFDKRARRDSPYRNTRIDNLRPAPKAVAANLIKDFCNTRRMKQFYTRINGYPCEKLFDCAAGHSLCIDAYGQIQGCMSLRDPKLALDVRARPDALHHALIEMPKILGALEAHHSEYFLRCARCFLRGLCDSCPANSWMEYGFLDFPVEHLCQVTHEYARFLGLLSPSENAWDVSDWESRVFRLKTSLTSA